jgi:hypothetical protein
MKWFFLLALGLFPLPHAQCQFGLMSASLTIFSHTPS